LAQSGNARTEPVWPCPEKHLPDEEEDVQEGHNSNDSIHDDRFHKNSQNSQTLAYDAVGVRVIEPLGSFLFHIPGKSIAG
jgi:hypothetical protein